jgi:hypothetical protein
MSPVLDATTDRPNFLTTPQFEIVLRVWRLTGWPPLCGYGVFALSATIAANKALTATLTSVDFDSPTSVANAVSALHDSRERMWKPTKSYDEVVAETHLAPT